MSSTAVTDFYRPLVKSRRRRAGGLSEAHYLRVARLFAVLFGVLLAGVALAFARHDRLLWEVFKWVGLIFGGMLGIFLLAVATRTRGHDLFNAVAMLTSVGLLVALKWVQERYDVVYIAWPWWIVIGTAWTFGLAACFSTKRDGA
jgi:hypothetical protein